MNKEIVEALNRLEDKFDSKLDRVEKKIDKLDDNLTKFKVNNALIMGGLLTAWETIKRKLGL